MGVIKSSYRGAKKTVGWFQNLIALGILTLMGFGGIVWIHESLKALIAGEDDVGISLILLILGLIGLCFPIVFIREKFRDRKLLRWLAEHADELAEGAIGPGGLVYHLDTVLVRYKANLSVVVVSTGFESGFYQQGNSSLIPKIVYTLFTALFGWWMLDVQLWLENLTAITENLGDSDVITVADLFEPEGAE